MSEKSLKEYKEKVEELAGNYIRSVLEPIEKSPNVEFANKASGYKKNIEVNVKKTLTQMDEGTVQEAKRSLKKFKRFLWKQRVCFRCKIIWEATKVGLSKITFKNTMELVRVLIPCYIEFKGKGKGETQRGGFSIC